DGTYVQPWRCHGEQWKPAQRDRPSRIHYEASAGGTEVSAVVGWSSASPATPGSKDAATTAVAAVTAVAAPFGVSTTDDTRVGATGAACPGAGVAADA